MRKPVYILAFDTHQNDLAVRLLNIRIVNRNALCEKIKPKTQ